MDSTTANGITMSHDHTNKIDISASFKDENLNIKGLKEKKNFIMKDDIPNMTGTFSPKNH